MSDYGGINGVVYDASEMHVLGRTLQFIGLCLLPAGLMFGLQYEGSGAMTLELGCLGAGALMFYSGWLIQKRAGPG
jgi:hypothetical protein